MGFGTSPYGTGPFGFGVDSPTAETPADLSSSRSIDFVRRKYTLDDDGGYEPMDDTAQRVSLLVAFSTQREPLIDPRSMERQRQRIAEALKPMTTGTEPAIKVHAITVANERPGVTSTTVTYTNLLTGTKTTVTR